MDEFWIFISLVSLLGMWVIVLMEMNGENRFIMSFMITAALIALIFNVIHVHKQVQKYESLQIEQKIAECEAELPRNEHCEIVIEARREGM